MKKLLIPILFIAAFFAISEQSKPKPNIYISTIAIVVFMFGMMQLSAKTPSKNLEDQENKENLENKENNESDVQ